MPGNPNQAAEPEAPSARAERFTEMRPQRRRFSTIAQSAVTSKSSANDMYGWPGR